MSSVHSATRVGFIFYNERGCIVHLSPNVLQDVERKMALLDLEGPSTEGLSSICPPLVFPNSSTLSETEHRSLLLGEFSCSP